MLEMLPESIIEYDTDEDRKYFLYIEKYNNNWEVKYKLCLLECDYTSCVTCAALLRDALVAELKLLKENKMI